MSDYITDYDSEDILCPVATVSFIRNMSNDIYPLLELATVQAEKTTTPLLKSIIVLLGSYWKSFCLELGKEALNTLTENIDSARHLPMPVLETVAQDIKQDSNELAVWALADDDWRHHINNYFGHEVSNRIFNTYSPGPKQIDHYFYQLTGIEKITNTWYWEQDEYPFISTSCSARQAQEKLQHFLDLERDIAHQQTIPDLSPQSVHDYYTHLLVLAIKTHAALKDHIEITEEDR